MANIAGQKRQFVSQADARYKDIWDANQLSAFIQCPPGVGSLLRGSFIKRQNFYKFTKLVE